MSLFTSLCAALKQRGQVNKDCLGLLFFTTPYILLPPPPFPLLSPCQITWFFAKQGFLLSCRAVKDLLFLFCFVFLWLFCFQFLLCPGGMDWGGERETHLGRKGETIGAASRSQIHRVIVVDLQCITGYTGTDQNHYSKVYTVIWHNRIYSRSETFTL